MIHFPSALSVQAVEAFLAKLNGLDSSIVQLPVETRSYQFAGLASATQALMTWAKQSDNSELSLRLITSSSNRDLSADRVNEVINRPHELAAAMLTNTIASTGFREGFHAQREIYNRAKNAIENQHRSPHGQQRGGLCWFAFVDHSSLAFDPHYYLVDETHEPQVRQLSQLRGVIAAMIIKSMAVVGGSEALPSNTLDAIGRLFYELFINTHEHGRLNEQGNQAKKSFRLMMTNGINLQQAALDSFVEKFPALANFVQNNKQQNRFVEISIVDSGLGLVDRWCAARENRSTATLSLADEYEVFEKCFRFRQTSTMAIHRGNGLPAVLGKLTELGAFLRVRTGRLSLYWDLAAQPFHDENHLSFNDSQTGDLAVKELSENAKVAGVAVTLLIPLQSKRVNLV
jgi:hypothetical protein